MGERINLNNDWKFMENFSEELLTNKSLWEPIEKIRIPHTVKELPFHYFDEKEYQMISTYRKFIFGDPNWREKNVLLTFDGIAHDSQVYINGALAKSHHCGYTAFTVDITDLIKIGVENEIVVKVDSRENLNVPPFGFVIDYMTYGGIYRDVYIDIKEKSYLKDVFVTTKLAKDGLKSATNSKIEIAGPKHNLTIRQYIKKYGSDDEYKVLAKEHVVTEDGEIELVQDTGEVELWDIDSPNLYILKTELIKDEKVIDEKEVRFGYRKAVFHSDGFYLNGKKIKIRGLNRHQSYAYVGYAMPKSMQQLDADILKNELGVNAVRTSHYPQSHYFLDRCDELGLLVFTEIPGWQHIGDEEWKNQAVENTRDMILQYRNHTSIVLWGVRINESVDDDEFYERTNAVAHELDPSRQTGGVRCYKKGSLLEDVYTYNDFSHTGNNSGCEKKFAVTSDINKPYLVSEYNGHMYPCKTYDWEEHRREHAIRHANVLNSVAGTEGVAGSFGWCMFDYNTHKDFGSGDRICYHGVMDMFRNPKMAAFVYACEQDKEPVLEISSSMDIGEHPGSNRGDIYIFTNADSVKMYKNDKFIKEYTAKDSKYTNLKHGPIRIDDYIGSALEDNEGMDYTQAEAVKVLLNETARGGLYNLPKLMYIKAGLLIAKYQMKMSDMVKLYNKYIGDWGGESTTYRFEAIKNDEVVKTLCVKPMTEWKINAEIDHDLLVEENSYDVAAVRFSAVDENGNVLHFCNDPVEIITTGPIEIVGPRVVSLQGGLGGTYIRTKRRQGSASITVKAMNGTSKSISLNVKI
ncbi:MAG: glycoside hydrolase family 2 TIM barrel-domain containing protein [Lachnospiraceae bacterium]|nr:glycoside hydrolase family 2 TIM barrel-domain containing protein [Lachnospiraceae bacterium]